MILLEILCILFCKCQEKLCKHEWKIDQFWKDRAEGEYGQKCVKCGIYEWTNSPDQNNVVYKIANVNLSR